MNWKLKNFNELSCEEMYNILKIRSEVFIIEQTCVYQDCDGKDKKAAHLFLEDNNEIIAYCRIFGKGIVYNEASIGRVLVNKNYRKKGFANELMAKAIAFVENTLNESEIKIQAQAYLVDFYGSHGFKGISDEYLEDDIPHVDMIYKK